MSIDALLDVLEREAQAEAARLISEAQRQAGEILARADAEADRRRADGLHRLEQEARRAVARRTAATARGFRAERLQERAAVLERVLAEAERELRTAGADRYDGQLAAMVAATLQFLDGTPAVIHCRPEIAARVEQCRGERTGLTVVPGADAAAGILGEAADGSVVVDNTLPALLRRRAPELAVAVAARLEAT